MGRGSGKEKKRSYSVEADLILEIVSSFPFGLWLDGNRNGWEGDRQVG